MPGPGPSFLGAEEAGLVAEVLGSWELSRYRFDSDGQAPASMVYRFEREIEQARSVRHCLATNGRSLLGPAGVGDANLSRRQSAQKGSRQSVDSRRTP
jgi:hypothetical protein